MVSFLYCLGSSWSGFFVWKAKKLAHVTFDFNKIRISLAKYPANMELLYYKATVNNLSLSKIIYFVNFIIVYSNK